MFSFQIFSELRRHLSSITGGISGLRQLVVGGGGIRPPEYLEY